MSGSQLSPVGKLKRDVGGSAARGAAVGGSPAIGAFGIGVGGTATSTPGACGAAGPSTLSAMS